MTLSSPLAREIEKFSVLLGRSCLRSCLRSWANWNLSWSLENEEKESFCICLPWWLQRCLWSAQYGPLQRARQAWEHWTVLPFSASPGPGQRGLMQFQESHSGPSPALSPCMRQGGHTSRGCANLEPFPHCSFS